MRELEIVEVPHEPDDGPWSLDCGDMFPPCLHAAKVGRALATPRCSQSGVVPPQSKWTWIQTRFMGQTSFRKTGESPHKPPYLEVQEQGSIVGISLLVRVLFLRAFEAC